MGLTLNTLRRFNLLHRRLNGLFCHHLLLMSRIEESRSILYEEIVNVVVIVVDLAYVGYCSILRSLSLLCDNFILFFASRDYVVHELLLLTGFYESILANSSLTVVR